MHVPSAAASFLCCSFQVWEVWHLEMVCCHHKIVNAQVGCTNQILLPLHVMWNDIPQKEVPPAFRIVAK